MSRVLAGPWEDDVYDDIEPPRDPINIATDQVNAALTSLEAHPHTFVRWPWLAVDRLAGGMRRGTVVILGAFSGGGKTTYMTSATDRWYESERRQYVLPLEIRPEEYRTYWACYRAGVYPGDVFSGEIHNQPNGTAKLDAIRAELGTQWKEPKLSRVHVSEQTYIDRSRLRIACEEAVHHGAEMVIVDHVDHIEGTPGQSFYQESVATLKASLRLAKELNLLLILTSQLNNQATAGSPLAKYQPPQVQHFYMGQHKIQVATTVLGLFRPLRSRREDESPEDYDAFMKRARSGAIEPKEALEPNTMGVVLVKSRNYGGREGGRAFLEVSNGRVMDRLPSSLDRGPHR